MSTKPKRLARALQVRTGWSYMECLRCVNSMSDEEIEKLILARKKADAAGQ